MVLPEIGGGRFERSRLQELDELPSATALRISGLDQPTFEHLITHHGARFSALHFWKCPRIEDLSPLEDMPHLELVAFYWNQRSTQLWDFRRTPRIRGLCVEDFTKLRSLDGLVTATSLRELVFGDAIDRKTVFETLDPLQELRALQRLEFTPRKIADNRVEPLGSLSGLRQLDCPTNLFTSRQFAWLHARLPLAADSRVLQPYVRLPEPIGETDVLLVGRGKPFLNSTTGSARIEKHVAQFRRAVAEFRASPDAVPD